jgi:hypothetical protein
MSPGDGLSRLAPRSLPLLIRLLVGKRVHPESLGLQRVMVDRVGFEPNSAGALAVGSVKLRQVIPARSDDGRRGERFGLGIT